MFDPISAGLSIAGGALGAFGSGGGEGKIHPDDSVPKHLLPDWRALTSSIMDLKAPSYYPNSTIAPYSDQMQQALNRLYNSGAPGHFGQQAQANSFYAGKNALSGVNTGMNYMNRLNLFGPNQFNYDQGTFDQVYGNLMPGIGGAQDAATRDIYRQLGEQQLPGIRSAASGTGGGYGTKAFNEGAIATRGALDRAADVNAQFRMNALNQANQGGMRGGELNLGSANDLNRALIQGYTNMGNLGANLVNQGFNMNQANLGNAMQAADYRQNTLQQMQDEDVKRWNYQQQLPWSTTERRLSMMPGSQGAMPNPGTGGMDPWTGFLNGAMGTLGLYNAYQNMGGAQPQQVAPPVTQTNWSQPWAGGWNGQLNF